MTSKASSNPYKELLTDDLVESALRKELGTDAHLESYKVVDFTKAGDNFVSIVTSVEVNYNLHGTKGKQSYIAKLNNGKMASEAFDKFIHYGYLREPIALGPILDSMNKLLEDLKQPPIKAPKCFSRCNDRGKEVMLAEDLRNHGFVMFDKMKGMDYKHATFVMEELGRLHASSILFEIEIKGRTLEKEFPLFNDSCFADQDNPDVVEISKVLQGQVQMSIDMLNSLKKSEEVNKWWNNLKCFVAEIWYRNSDPSEKFNLYIHGDCWNNNMLFRYDETGEPIDYRLVDFQIVRRSSPACDLVYFFYTSLTGEMRQKYMIKLLVDYYLSFSKILLLAKRPIPFTFKELREETEARTMFGTCSAMLVLPTTLVKVEDALKLNEAFSASSSEETNAKRQKSIENAQNNPIIKSRFLSMFDEMLQAGICERTRTICNPYKILTEELVEEALQKDLGNQAKLKAFEVRNFTKRGDNYATTVIAIKVHYDEEGTIKDKSYVVKLNPQRDLEGLTPLFEDFYNKEIIILSTIVIGMSDELKKLELPELKVPKALSFTTEKFKEVIIMNNLRLEGFVMFDRKKGMNLKHGLLVMEEIGRFHASSLLYEDTLKRPIREEFHSNFAEEWNTPDNRAFDMFNKMLFGQYDSVIALLNGIEGYEKVIDWINKIKTSATKVSIYLPPFNPENKKFNVLNHGDCWNNNIIFKYNEAGDPTDIRLLDFQISRVVSVACDLNYFFYSSITGAVRQKHMNQFLVEYYVAFSKVLLLANKAVPFTFEELKKEVKNNMLYGCITGMMLITAVLINPEDTLTFDDFNEDTMEDAIKEQGEKFVQAALKDENFYTRFLTMFDEMMQHGVIT